MIDTNEIRRRIDSEGRYIGNMPPRDVIALCDEIDRLRGVQGRTVGVRVAVAVDKSGNWCANGWQGATEGEARDTASEMVAEGESIYWLTATLPVPEETVVVARVEGE